MRDAKGLHDRETYTLPVAGGVGKKITDVARDASQVRCICARDEYDWRTAVRDDGH